MNMISAAKWLEGNYQKAERMLDRPDRIGKLLKQLERKLQEVPVLGGALACIPQMGMLVNSYLKKQYTEIQMGIVAAMISVLVYFVAPIDAIPDLIPGIGYLDDATVAAAALYLVRSDLEKYMAWRTRVGLDEQYGE